MSVYLVIVNDGQVEEFAEDLAEAERIKGIWESYGPHITAAIMEVPL